MKRSLLLLFIIYLSTNVVAQQPATGEFDPDSPNNFNLAKAAEQTSNPQGVAEIGGTREKWSVRQDVLIVTLTILGEAAGEKEAGMYAVACVIEKRSKNRRLTPMATCLQSGLVKGKRYHQFSCWNDSSIPKLSKKHFYNGAGKLTKEGFYALMLARSVHYDWRYRFDENKQKLKLDYVNNADHYCTLKTNPYWAFDTIKKDGKPTKVAIEPAKIIGNHKFYRLRK